mmetsp:Transcript_121237/g.343483  ORF Transcript_121237/g.343483 Transcript_121237/m.343483 type:complete len:499 (+) Transcript_121237:391-1887(+)
MAEVLLRGGCTRVAAWARRGARRGLGAARRGPPCRPTHPSDLPRLGRSLCHCEPGLRLADTGQQVQQVDTGVLQQAAAQALEAEAGQAAQTGGGSAAPCGAGAPHAEEAREALDALECLEGRVLRRRRRRRLLRLRRQQPRAQLREQAAKRVRGLRLRLRLRAGELREGAGQRVGGPLRHEARRRLAQLRQRRGQGRAAERRRVGRRRTAVEVEAGRVRRRCTIEGVVAKRVLRRCALVWAEAVAAAGAKAFPGGLAVAEPLQRPGLLRAVVREPHGDGHGHALGDVPVEVLHEPLRLVQVGHAHEGRHVWLPGVGVQHFALLHHAKLIEDRSDGLLVHVQRQACDEHVVRRVREDRAALPLRRALGAAGDLLHRGGLGLHGPLAPRRLVLAPHRVQPRLKTHAGALLQRLPRRELVAVHENVRAAVVGRQEAPPFVIIPGFDPPGHRNTLWNGVRCRAPLDACCGRGRRGRGEIDLGLRLAHDVDRRLRREIQAGAH